MRSTCLAALLLAAGCFSEPPNTNSSEADDDATGNGSSSTSGSSSGDDDGSTTFLFGSSSSTGFFLTSTGTDTGATETGAPMPLLDLYDDCNRGDWTSSNGADAPGEVTCLNMPDADNAEGGAWKYAEFPLGGDEKVLILRPYPINGGIVQANFNAGQTNLEDGANLRFDYRYVNTNMKQNDVGAMTFQVLLNPPDALPGQGMILEQALNVGNGTMGTVDIDLGIMGPGDNLVLVVLADTYAPGQGVALTNAYVYGP